MHYRRGEGHDRKSQEEREKTSSTLGRNGEERCPAGTAEKEYLRKDAKKSQHETKVDLFNSKRERGKEESKGPDERRRTKT